MTLSPRQYIRRTPPIPAISNDNYSDAERPRYLALQIVFSGIAAIVFLGVGGALGEHGWRTPFWMYLLSIVIMVPLGFILFEPKQTDRPPPATVVGTKFPLAGILGICSVTLFAAICFYIPIVQNGFLFNAIGIHSPQTIGLAGAAGAIANLSGSAAFVALTRYGHNLACSLSFVLMGAGLIIVSFGGSLPVFIAGGVISAFGGGILIPTLVNWALSKLRFEQRGRSVGLWQAAFWLGQFISPLVVLAVMPAAGSLARTVTGFGAALVVLSAAWAAATYRSWAMVVSSAAE